MISISRVVAGRGMSHSRRKEPVEGRKMRGNMMKRFGRRLAWLLAVLIGGIAAAHAQAGYPDRPVKIIVPIGPGGSYDLVGRHIADGLSIYVADSFVVANTRVVGS